MVKKFFSILFFIIFYCSLFTVYNLHSSTSSTGWKIFRKIQSPRPKSITATPTLLNDLSGVLYNPSILARLDQREIFTIAESGIIGDRITGLFYGHPLGKQSAGSIGIVYYNAGEMTLYWIERGIKRKRRVTAQNDLLGLISYGCTLPILNNKIHTGLTLKFATSRIADTVFATAYAVDIGVSYLPIQRLVFSLAGQNIGTTTEFLNQKDKLPTSVWAGAGYQTTFRDNMYLTIAGDVAYILDESRFTPSIGIEFGKLPIRIFTEYRFYVREGIFNIGASFTMKNFTISYAYGPARWLSSTHKISLAYRFGKKEKIELKPVREEKLEVKEEVKEEVADQQKVEPEKVVEKVVIPSEKVPLLEKTQPKRIEDVPKEVEEKVIKKEVSFWEEPYFYIIISGLLIIFFLIWRRRRKKSN